jgi:hypothetical protein
MRCWKCFRDTYIIYITAEHLRICDSCYGARTRVLNRIRAKRKARAEIRAAIPTFIIDTIHARMHPHAPRYTK